MNKNIHPWPKFDKDNKCNQSDKRFRFSYLISSIHEFNTFSFKNSF